MPEKRKKYHYSEDESSGSKSKDAPQDSPNSKLRNGIIIAIVTAIFGGIVTLITTRTAPGMDGFTEDCLDRRKELNDLFKEVRYPPSQGLNPSDFYLDTSFVDFNYADKNPKTLKAAFLNQYRLGTFKKGFEKIKIKSPFSLNFDLIESRQLEAYENGELINEAKGIQMIFGIFDESLLCNDCKDGSICKYSIILYTPKSQRDLLPIEILDLFDNNIQDSKSFISDITSLSGDSVDLGQIATELINDNNFIQKVANAISKNREYLRLINIGINDENIDEELSNFPLSSYKLSTLHHLILERLAIVLHNRMKLNPNSTYVITCNGYTDTAPMNGEKPYLSNGLFSEAYDLIGFGPKNALTVYDNHALIQPKIDSNLKLSYARAYSGISFLYQILNQRFRNDDLHIKVVYKYRGLGPDKNDIPDLNKRRIEIKLEQQ